MSGYMDLRRPRVCQHSNVGFVKCGKDIYSPKISDEFDYGGSASLNNFFFKFCFHINLDF